jgi:sulfite reductase alpha subunit-like flavoprotein
MAREVGFSLAQKAQSAYDWNDPQVKDWTEGLKRTGKWREDVWG